MSRVLEGITRIVRPISVMIWPFRAVAVGTIPRTATRQKSVLIWRFRALAVGDHEDCEPSEECPELTMQNSGGGDPKDCEPSEECPDLAAQTPVGAIMRIVSPPRSVLIWRFRPRW